MDTSFFKLFIASCLVAVALGHGRLIDPPARNAAWRFGHGTPQHYTDNELNCGGFSRQWHTNGGKCGVCGDPYDKKNPEFVHPGKYATGKILKAYKRGQQIEVKVDLTSNHRGYFVFTVGKLVQQPFSSDQLTHEVLLLDGKKGYDLPSPASKVFTVKLRLPADLTCDHCVLQWKYTAGNNWGCDPDGTCGLGHGPNETFINCADIKIEA